MKYIISWTRIIFEKSTLALLILCCCSLLFVQQCKDGNSDDESLDFIASMFANGNFTDNGNGTVTDNNTKLTWMKCAYGQQRNTATNDCTLVGGGTTYGAKSVAFCESVNEFSTTECTNLDPVNPTANSGPAYTACANETTGGHTDWRLPSSAELTGLASVLDRKTLLYSFPQTPDDKYFWSGSAKAGSATGAEAYGVSFATATFADTTIFHKADSYLYVRCVRP